MNVRTNCGTLVFLALCSAAPSAVAQSVDLVVGDITSATNYVLGGTPKAYSLGISLCNLGDAPAGYNAVTFEHPIVTQNLYRLQNGRFVQIGQAWAQHLTSALQENLCSTCNPWPDGTMLGAGCSSTDSASAMGIQANFGAKSEVNAAAGSFTWPRVNMGDPTTTTPAAFKRLQAAASDITIGGQYFVSVMCLSTDDGRASHELNNESYRRVLVGFINSGLPLTMQDTTRAAAPRQSRRGTTTAQANILDPGVLLTPVDIARDGRMWIGSEATDLGGGMWHYEYAVQNLTSDRSGGSFTVPLPAGAVVSNPGFHATAYHSGEVYSNAAWTFATDASSVSWTSPGDLVQNPNANALRWDTIDNFWFDCNVAPASGSVTIGLFKPGVLPTDPTSISGAATAPGSSCGSADFNCDGDTGTDADIEAFFACLAGNCPLPPCTSNADFNGDGDVGTDADIEAFFRVLAGGTC